LVQVAQEGVIPIAAQLSATEKATAEKEAHAHFDSKCPGCCVAEDLFLAGTQRGAGADTR